MPAGVAMQTLCVTVCQRDVASTRYLGDFGDCERLKSDPAAAFGIEAEAMPAIVVRSPEPRGNEHDDLVVPEAPGCGQQRLA